MNSPVKLCLSILSTTLITACGGDSNNSNTTQQSTPLGFANSTPIVAAQGTSGVSVSIATNKDNVNASYIVLATGSPAPTTADYFSSSPMSNRFSMNIPSANSTLQDSNDERLTPNTSYDVYVAVQLAQETVVSPSPTTISTNPTTTAVSWSENCDTVDPDKIFTGNITVTNNDDLTALADYLVIDGTLTLSRNNLPTQVDLNNLVCVRNLLISNSVNLETLNVNGLKVVESFRSTSSSALAISSLNLPSLLSADVISLDNVAALTSVSAPQIKSLGNLAIEGAAVLKNLSLPEVTSISQLSISKSALDDLSGMAKLNSISELVLFSMASFSLENSPVIDVKQKLLISNAANIHQLGGLRFNKLDQISIINTPLDDNDIYQGDNFEVSDVNIVSTSVQDINPFLLNMQKVDSLRLVNNDNLTELVFYQREKLTSISVSGHNQLTDLSVPNATEIDQILVSERNDDSIFGVNALLTTINFSDLTTAGDIVIQGNLALTTLGLTNLKSVVDMSEIPNRCDFVNNGLADITFPELETATCRFWFKGSKMENISFPVLTTLSNTTNRTFEVGDLNSPEDGNSNLQSISLPELTSASSRAFIISYNDLLSTIQIDKLPEARAINILNNPVMSQCRAMEIWTQLGRRGIAPRNNDDTATCL